MGKRAPADVDERNLQTKVNERRVASEGSQGGSTLRQLHKRLKRAQRKRRLLEAGRRRAAAQKTAPQADASAGA